MSANTLLEILPARDWHSEPTATERDLINQQISSIHRLRELGGRSAENLQNTPLEEIDPDKVFQTDCPALNRFKLLQLELNTRLRMFDFFRLERHDAQAACDRAAEDERQIIASVRKRLVKAGYVDDLPESGVPGRIIPDFINRHPEVIAIRARCESLGGFQGAYRQNDEGLELVRQEMEALRSRAVGA